MFYDHWPTSLEVLTVYSLTTGGSTVAAEKSRHLSVIFDVVMDFIKMWLQVTTPTHSLPLLSCIHIIPEKQLLCAAPPWLCMWCVFSLGFWPWATGVFVSAASGWGLLLVLWLKMEVKGKSNLQSGWKAVCDCPWLKVSALLHLWPHPIKVY